MLRKTRNMNFVPQQIEAIYSFKSPLGKGYNRLLLKSAEDGQHVKTTLHGIAARLTLGITTSGTLSFDLTQPEYRILSKNNAHKNALDRMQEQGIAISFSGEHIGLEKNTVIGCFSFRDPADEVVLMALDEERKKIRAILKKRLNQ